MRALLTERRDAADDVAGRALRLRSIGHLGLLAAKCFGERLQVERAHHEHDAGEEQQRHAPPVHRDAAFAPAPLRYGSPQRFTLVIDSPKLEVAQFGGYRLVGTIQNKDKVDVRHVRIVALLLSAQKKIIAMQEGFAPQQVLPAGDASPLAISVHQVNGTPKSFRLYTSAMAAQ